MHRHAITVLKLSGPPSHPLWETEEDNSSGKVSRFLSHNPNCQFPEQHYGRLFLAQWPQSTGPAGSGWFVLMRTVPFAHVHASLYICDVRDIFYNHKENVPSLPCPVEHAFSGQLSSCCVRECALGCVAGLGNWGPHVTHMSRDNTRSEADIGEQWSSVWSTRDNTPIIKGCQNDSNQPHDQTSLCFSE